MLSFEKTTTVEDGGSLRCDSDDVNRGSPVLEKVKRFGGTCYPRCEVKHRRCVDMFDLDFGLVGLAHLVSSCMFFGGPVKFIDWAFVLVVCNWTLSI